jgi:predicted amidohydrolase YtcJ
MFKHFSAHVVVANSLAIQLLGIDNTTTPPPGGIFERFANGSLTGVFKEYAILPFIIHYGINFAELSTAQIMSTVESYFRVGITTAHDISFSMAEPTVFKALGDSLPIDINSYFWISSADRTNLYNVMENYSTNRVKHRGAKFLLDGSIQAYTALLGSPYWVPKAQQYDNLDNYVYDNTRSCSTESCGQNNFPYQSLLRLFFKDFHDRGYDVLAHCNGDGILDNFLDALEYTRNNSQTPTASNFVVIHGQTARD